MKNILLMITAMVLIAGARIHAADKKLPKLLDLGATKCAACQKLAPILEELQKDYADKFETEFIDVWIKENAEKAKTYKIQLIPTQIFFDPDGKELWRHTGFITKADILAKWKELGYDFGSKAAEVKQNDSGKTVEPEGKTEKTRPASK